MTDVVWCSFHDETPARGYWDQEIVEHILPADARHHVGFGSLVASGAVVVVPARAQGRDIDRLNHELSQLGWCVLILTGDEEREFPIEAVDHPNMILWVQTPDPRRDAGRADQFFGCGWTPGTRQAFAGTRPVARDLDWFFAGQLNNRQRDACLAGIRGCPNGELLTTEGFTLGMPQARYRAELRRAKVAPCPSGPFTPDTFRLYEALEAGCIPVVDSAAPNWGDVGYWRFLFGENPPFPVLERWSDFPAVLEELLARWPANVNRIGAWWAGYKRRLAHMLVDDVTEVRGERPEPSQPITVLIPTSPIPSHPSTEVIDATVASVRERLPEAEIILMIDGVRSEQEHRRADYDEYVNRLLRKADHEWGNCLPLLFDEHAHQAAMTARALDEVRTPLILFVEHDTPLVGPDVPWDRMTASILGGIANVIRLSHEASVLQPHAHLMLDPRPQEIAGLPLIRTVQWSQRPHLASTDFYRWMIRTYFGRAARTFIEDSIHGVLEVLWTEYREAGWEQFKLWLYAPDGDMKRSTHTCGRGDEPKFEPIWAYDGPTPVGAPRSTAERAEARIK